MASIPSLKQPILCGDDDQDADIEALMETFREVLEESKGKPQCKQALAFFCNLEQKEGLLTATEGHLQSVQDEHRIHRLF